MMWNFIFPDPIQTTSLGCLWNHSRALLIKQTRRRRKRECHMKMKLRVSAIIFQSFKVIILEKCVLTILELNIGTSAWDIRRQHWTFVIIWSRRPHNCKTGHFHVVERTRTSTKCQKMKTARAKRANTVFHCQICKFVGFLLPTSSWLLKLRIIFQCPTDFFNYCFSHRGNLIVVWENGSYILLSFVFVYI